MEFFRAGRSLSAEKIQKQTLFLGIFPEDVFPFRAYVFTLCFLARRRLPDECPKKYRFIGYETVSFFGVRKNVALLGDSTVWRLLQGCRRIESSQKAARLRFVTLSSPLTFRSLFLGGSKTS